ncbi:hypothetical protein VNO77_06782 [Canavalia gladiata]|uniref:Uncharacterized protein n=1 Tax=Canavalia gladiata TaxID=3824 RepID=A0AAN9MCN4_CANGL
MFHVQTVKILSLSDAAYTSSATYTTPGGYARLSCSTIHSFLSLSFVFLCFWSESTITTFPFPCLPNIELRTFPSSQITKPSLR